MVRRELADDLKERHTGTEMKKILCLILALCCVFSSMLLMTSCDETGTTDGTTPPTGDGTTPPAGDGTTPPAGDGTTPPAEDVDKAFFDAVAASKPTEIKTLTFSTFTNEDDESVSYNGTFITAVKANGDFEFTYTYQRKAEIDDAENPAIELDGDVATIPLTTIYCSNGKYSFDKIEWFSETPTEIVNQPKLNLSKEKLGAYTMNKAKTTLTATLTPAAAAEVLGITLNATSDVVIVISTNGSYLTRLTVSYEKGLNKFKIDTSYS